MAISQHYVKCLTPDCGAIYQRDFIPLQCGECGSQPIDLAPWNPDDEALTVKPLQLLEELVLWLQTCGQHRDEGGRLYGMVTDALVMLHRSGADVDELMTEEDA